MRQVRLEVVNQLRQALLGLKRINAVEECFCLSCHAEMFHALISEPFHKIVCKWREAILRVLCRKMSDLMPVLREQITGLKEKSVSTSRKPKSLMNLQDTHLIA
jgi:hypothetical protein